ncbi:hypothetical protein [Klebsiella sp. PL-2018]|uniref:hypothetical protein n=1 Tax=Klebsiella TaxID=570 RepID=UPI001C23B594|nr:hypothetical protein [Klebsiella sp. PL-2018]QXD01004.1 hypothetical protein MKleb_5503 [Klebsiella sp. PL-2018]
MPEMKPVIPTFEWCWTLVLTYIPGINLIFLLYWTFSSSVNPNKRNYARAAWLLLLLQFAVVWIAFMITYIAHNS